MTSPTSELDSLFDSNRKELTMASADTQELPWHLQGNYGPVQHELEVHDLEVTGEVPVEIEGSYYRNGFNPPSGWSDHWFFGTGMVHQVALSGGRALTYRNKYVRTPYFDKTPDLMTAMTDPTMSPANTNIIRHAGHLLVLEEAHRAWEVTPDLDTVSCFDFEGRFKGQSMTAHPKICPVTGELLFFGYQMFGEPYLTYYRADASGALVQTESIDIGRAVMMHDFNMTRNHIVFMDLPIVVGDIGPQYKPEEGARLGVMPRNGTNADVKWYEIEPCTVLPSPEFLRGGLEDRDGCLQAGTRTDAPGHERSLRRTRKVVAMDDRHRDRRSDRRVVRRSLCRLSKGGRSFRGTQIAIRIRGILRE